jgi:hypothetical protein
MNRIITLLKAGHIAAAFLVFGLKNAQLVAYHHDQSVTEAHTSCIAK